MTKSGKPSRILGLRYYVPYLDRENVTQDYDLSKDVRAFETRLVCMLNSMQFSLGTYVELYIVLTTKLAVGTVELRNGGEWWFKYAYVGVPSDFWTTIDRDNIVIEATVRALKFVRPEIAALVDKAESLVTEHADSLRFLLQTKETKKYKVEIYFSVPREQFSADLYFGLTNKATGEFFESAPMSTGSFGIPFGYKGPIKIKEIEKELPSFKSKPRPVMSELLSRL